MDKKTAETMTSPCGIPCFHCPAHLASKNAEIRKNVAQTLGIPEEQASCEGCRDAVGFCKVLKPDTQCAIYQCAGSRDILFCYECEDFPCNRLQPYADNARFPHNTKMYQLCMIKKLGIEKWANEEAAKIWDTYRSEPFDFNKILY
jgi:hypothetical protein